MQSTEAFWDEGEQKSPLLREGFIVYNGGSIVEKIEFSICTPKQGGAVQDKRGVAAVGGELLQNVPVPVEMLQGIGACIQRFGKGQKAAVR